MKKFLLVVLCLTGSYLFAQTGSQSGPSIRLNGYTTYAFADNHVDSYYSETSFFEGALEGGFEWGGGLEVVPAPGMGVEFLYLRLDSYAPIDYYDGGLQFTEFDIAHNYLFLGFNKYVNINPRVEPYGGLLLGMAIYNVTNPENSNTGSATKFAWGVRGGLNIWANERVGIKMQAALISAVQAVGGGIYFGTGGAGAGVTGFSTYYQFNLGGGLVFRLR
jgi:hypothetical protein